MVRVAETEQKAESQIHRVAAQKVTEVITVLCISHLEERVSKYINLTFYLFKISNESERIWEIYKNDKKSSKARIDQAKTYTII